MFSKLAVHKFIKSHNFVQAHNFVSPLRLTIVHRNRLVAKSSKFNPLRISVQTRFTKLQRVIHFNTRFKRTIPKITWRSFNSLIDEDPNDNPILLIGMIILLNAIVFLMWQVHNPSSDNMVEIVPITINIVDLGTNFNRIKENVR